MTMSRTTHRLMTATASVAVIACLPGLTGIASAHDVGTTSDRSSTITQSTMTQVQFAAVAAAREAYFASVASANSTLKVTLDGYMTTIATQTATLRDAANAAFTAYRNAKDVGLDTTALIVTWQTADEAYRVALDAAKASFATQVDAARVVAKTAIDAAGTAYIKAITDAFAGQTVPDGLLELPRSGSHHDGAGHWASLGSGHDQREFGRNGGNGHGSGHDQRAFGHNGGNGHHGSARGMHR
jgi:hypothetical protein